MTAKNLDKTKAVNVVYEFFKQFSIWCGSSPLTPTTHELEKYLSKDLQMVNNGQLVVKSAADYLERLKKFQKKYSYFQISDPLTEPVVSGHQVVLYYHVDVTTHKEEHKQIYLMGLFTIEDDKISQWIEVSSEKNGGNWDK